MQKWKVKERERKRKEKQSKATGMKIDSRIDKVLEWHNSGEQQRNANSEQRKQFENEKNAANAKAFTSNYVAKKPLR